MGIRYRPGNHGLQVTIEGAIHINTWLQTPIKPKKGNPKPWLDFLEHLFPIEAERHDVMRWCATLIAKPAIRMLWAVLLIQRQQGVGKSTLMRILAALVG